MSDTPMTVDDALRLALEVTPSPARAHEALMVLRQEVLYRWEQRTALSFRLQDLRHELLAHLQGDDMHRVYASFHRTLATAEAWMHPSTLSEAASAHIENLKRQIRDLEKQLATTVTGDVAVVASICPSQFLTERDHD